MFEIMCDVIGSLPQFTIIYKERVSRLQIIAKGPSLEQALLNMKNVEAADFIRTALSTQLKEANFNR
jgi:hypothetical protein